MQRFKNILLASIGGKDDHAAIARANLLAQHNHAKVCLVRVVEELPGHHTVGPQGVSACNGVVM